VRFKMIDGTVYTGRSYDDIVTLMSGDKLTEPRSLATYRRATAKRVVDNYGRKVDTTDSETFVKSLVAAGLMTRVQR